MSIIKSLAVGSGDMFYIVHGNDSFTLIDCDLNEENAGRIIAEIQEQSRSKAIRRFICTHPDDDHFGGLHWLDDSWPIKNFYVVQNQAIKDQNTESFRRYCELRDDTMKSFYLSKGCRRKWLNESDEARGSAGLSVLWPELNNVHFKAALAACDAGQNFNNTSAVLRYSIGKASFLWLGDLETQFMEKITDEIELSKTTVVFAAHHGRSSGKIPDSWLRKLDPQIIVLGEAPSRHMHYYTGYETITQNSAGDITMDCSGDQVHFYVGNAGYRGPSLANLGLNKFPNYLGSLMVETKYTLWD
ncbi:MAG: MBL fold metallo-hydrolase [Pseudoxanthomonas sp.]|nr:MBL fold metallo-hydrolase [Pseudoxanthomonas sp.]